MKCKFCGLVYDVIVVRRVNDEEFTQYCPQCGASLR